MTDHESCPDSGPYVSVHNRIADLSARVRGRLRLGLYVRLTRYGLGRDLAVPISYPIAKIPISVRGLESHDLIWLFSRGAASDDLTERTEAAVRRAFVSKGANNGFVAVDDQTGTPCHVQWLFTPQDNNFVNQMKGFPSLEKNQALLENAYTPPNYRGLGIMAAAMALIAERAADFGARYVLTFVGSVSV